MSKELPIPDQGFGFTEREQLFERITNERLLALIADERSVVHHLEVSTNNYGEFLFLTISRPVGEAREYRTFWGAGYHEQRERWLMDEWRWYTTEQFLHTLPQKITPEDTQALIQERLEEIAPYVAPPQQSRRAQLFELLADLTDEDGAYTDLEDMGIGDDDDLP